MVLSLWCADTAVCACFHKAGRTVPVKSAKKQGEEAALHFTAPTLLPLGLSQRKDGPWSSFSAVRWPRRQKPKVLTLYELKQMWVFPSVLSQSGSMSQSWGISPMSKTWGLVRDAASLRQRREREGVGGDENVFKTEKLFPLFSLQSLWSKSHRVHGCCKLSHWLIHIYGWTLTCSRISLYFLCG